MLRLLVTPARGRGRPPSRRVFGSIASAGLFALACSVYEPPEPDVMEIGGQPGIAGEEATAGSGGHDSVAGSSVGGVPSSAGTNPGTSGKPASVAGSSGGGLGGAASAGGEPGAEAGAGGGGEGGAPTVTDECPKDPNKLAPGECGCGVPEAPSATKADCQTLESLLVHRYDFEGTGTSVKDRVGVAHGVIAGGATLSKVSGKGVVQLTGGDAGSYVDLPNGILSSLKNATLEAWVTWGGGNAWQRIFDFGDSSAAVPEDNQANGKTYLFLTPKSSSGVVYSAFSLGATAQEVPASGTAVLAQSLKQVVVVVNDDADLLQLYVDGVKVGEHAWTSQLSKINDVNVWLGHSQYVGDPDLAAVYHEFRMYAAALSAAQVAATFVAGTDPAFLAY